MSRTLEQLQAEADGLRRALLLLVLTPHIRAYLEAHDPKALEQIQTALGEPADVKQSAYLCTFCGHRWGSPTPATSCPHCSGVEIRPMTVREFDEFCGDD